MNEFVENDVLAEIGKWDLTNKCEIDDEVY